MGKNSKRHRKQQLLAEFEALRPENVKHPEHCLLSDASLGLMRERGIDITSYPSFPPNHVAYPSGYLACLPAQVDGGNQIFGTEACFKSSMNGEDAITNMPSVALWGDDSGWHTSVSQYAPGPGPGDFLEHFETQGEAVASAISYFFETNQHVDAANIAPKEFLLLLNSDE